MAAAARFSQLNGDHLTDFDLAELRTWGLVEISADDLAESILERLRGAVEPPRTFRDSAYFVLGKKFDPSLKSFFVERMEFELSRDMEAVYQLMIALDNLREPVFAKDRTGYSVLDNDLNRRDAENYLRNFR